MLDLHHLHVSFMATGSKSPNNDKYYTFLGFIIPAWGQDVPFPAEIAKRCRLRDI